MRKGFIVSAVRVPADRMKGEGGRKRTGRGIEVMYVQVWPIYEKGS